MEDNSEKKEDEKDEGSDQISDIKKIMQLNKIGALFLTADKYDKAEKILKKTLDFYTEKKEKKEIPNFFYSILYCNLAKVYSCQKKFEEAKPLYIEVILNHPLFKLILKNSVLMEKYFSIKNLENLTTDKTLRKEEEILQKAELFLKYFEKDSESRKEFESKILDNFTSNKLNNKASLSDSLVNLAVIFQIENKDISVSLDMYILSILIDENNSVSNVNYNNYLRECNYKNKSDIYINKRIQFTLNDYSINIIPEDASIKNSNETSKDSLFTFICMKWGKKYDADYMNRLYNGIKKNMTKPFKLYCITDIPEGLNPEIKDIKLETKFSGWMKKSILFDEKILNQIEGINENSLICFIDLDMIIYNNIDFLTEYKGNFCLMKTDDIQCEGSHNGYNSSIVLYRRNFGRKIYDTMEKYEKEVTNQIVRFDHYLEFIVKNSDFTQDVFVGKILDYNTYCKDKSLNDLPKDGAIIAFPRSPKPHQCSEEWISKFWCLL